MSYRLLLCSLAAGLSVSVLAAEPSPVPPHWSYEGRESPAHWGELSADYATCSKGRNQSPVDLAEAIPTGKGKLSFRHRPQHYRVENNGHTIEAVPARVQEALVIGKRHFALKQFHFHVPSEHTFRTRQFPMEIHFVHQGRQDELAVLAVMVREGATNPALQPLLAHPLAPGESVALTEALDISPLLPARRTHFRLGGSLTTPPCSEGVNWVVFVSPIEASPAQIRRMAELIGHPNNRPVQPLNARIVIEEDR